MSQKFQARRDAFREMHRSGCFAIPNPWDAGSAKYLQTLGFKALATTSAGYAWSQGRADAAMTRELVLQHLRAIVDAPTFRERGFRRRLRLHARRRGGECPHGHRYGRRRLLDRGLDIRRKETAA
jgi:hypothetical protein